MVTKNLAIREEVYKKLSEAKTEGESFSDVIQKLLEKRGDLLSLWEPGETMRRSPLSTPVSKR